MTKAKTPRPPKAAVAAKIALPELAKGEIYIGGTIDASDGDDYWPEGTADKIEHNPSGYLEEYQGAPVRIHLRDRAGADPAEWPQDLRVREYPA